MIYGFPALGMAMESPQRGLGLWVGKARTWNVQPGPQATPIPPSTIKINAINGTFCLLLFSKVPAHLI